MENFKLPEDLRYNNGFIKNPTAYLKDRGCMSWLYLVGEEFSKMENGMSYEEVQEATPYSVNVISDPPLTLDLELATQHMNALDSLPRPTLISCRTGPRASAGQGRSGSADAGTNATTAQSAFLLRVSAGGKGQAYRCHQKNFIERHV